MGEVIVNKLNGGLVRRTPSKDGVSGLIIMMASIVGGAQVGNVYKLESLADAEALLITEAKDKATEYLAWNTIADIFRVNPNATLYIYIADVAQSYTLAVQNGIRTLIQETNGEVRQAAVQYNGAIPATNVATLAAIAQAQVEATTAYTNHAPISNIIVDGIKLTGVEDLHALNAKNVSVMAGQNLAIASYDNGGAGVINPLVDKPWAFHTAVGIALGVESLAAVNESIAWVEKFNVFGGTLANPAVLGATIVGQEALLSTMDDNGFMYLRTYVGKAGIYFNASHTATELTSDYATIQNNRTIDKAVRLIRLALLPSLNSPINVDPATGKLSPAVIKSLERIARKSLTEMDLNEEYSSALVTVDPDQDILATSNIAIGLEIVPTGTAENITVTIGFVNPFN